MADQPRRGGHRLASLDGWRRWTVIASIVALGLLPLLCAGRAVADGWTPTGDVAVIAVRSLDAWTGQAPLVGQPTTGREVSGEDSFHPGPFENWFAGPWLHALGPAAGLALAVGAINGAALAASVWLAFRRGGPVLAALTAVGLALLVHSLGSASLWDPYNSELPTYPLIAAALAAWCVLAGDLVAVPILVVAASVAAQAHVAGATSVAPMVLVALIGLVRELRRDPTAMRRHRTALASALALAVVCWLPPIAQELVGPSNLAPLVRTATAAGPALGLAFTLERVVTALAPVPLFARRSGAYGFLETRGALGVVAAALVAGGAASLALAARWARRRREPVLLVAVVGASLVVTTLVWAGSPPVTAFRVDSIRWLWVLGLLTWLALAWSAWWFVPASARRRLQTAAVPALGVVVALAALVALAGSGLGEVRDHELLEPVARLGDQTVEQLEPGRYRVRASGSDAVVTVAPAIALRLEEAGFDVAVDPGPFSIGYGVDRQRPTPAPVASIAVTSDEPAAGEVLATETFPGPSGDDVTIWVVREAAP